SGITIRHGYTACADLVCDNDSGGGIFMDAIFTGGNSLGPTLTLTDCVIEENTAVGGGGGIYVGGQVKLIHSIVADNTASFGGGISVQPGGLSLTVKNSAISGNSAGQGGGISLYIQGGVAHKSRTARSAATTRGNLAAEFTSSTRETCGSTSSTAPFRSTAALTMEAVYTRTAEQPACST